MQLPAQMNFSIGVQRELGGGYFVEATYVGNRGEHLIRQPDVNRAPFDALRANAALPSAQRVSVNSLRPYAGYSAIRMRISDADSTYNSMQLYATKRRGDFQFTVSYTLGKVAHQRQRQRRQRLRRRRPATSTTCTAPPRSIAATPS